MCFSLFSTKRHSRKPAPQSPSNASHGPPGVAAARKHYSRDRRRNSSSMEYSTNSTTSSSSSSAAYFCNHSVRSSASISSLRDSLSDNPTIYSFSQLRSATADFVSKPLHRSSSSTSWRCSLDGKDVILTQRRLRRPISVDELRDKLTRICRSHHAGLVRLHGASISGNSLYLVHQRVEGASLRDCLRNPKNPNFTVLSNWLSRVQIATDVADAIDYLHNCSGMKVGFIHNHIKSSSIIVTDPTLNGKLCHLGTAQLCGEAVDDDEKVITSEHKKTAGVDSKFEGTRGYMSPEFQASGVATRKSDVYAFGVVLLELLSGAEPISIKIDEESGEFQKVSVIESAKEAVGGGSGKVRKWVDRRLKDSFPVEVVERMTQLAVKCVEEDPKQRPDMSRVAGLISQLYLESNTWAQQIGIPTDFSVTLGPR